MWWVYQSFRVLDSQLSAPSSEDSCCIRHQIWHSRRPSIDTIDPETVRYVRSIRSIRYLKKFEKFKTPLLEESSRSFRDSLESQSDSIASWDDRLHSPKSGISNFPFFFDTSWRKNAKISKCHCWANEADCPRILSTRILIRKNPGTIGSIRPNVTLFFFQFRSHFSHS